MKPEILIELRALCDAGIGYRRISKQLGINLNTCKSACRKYRSTKNLGPKVKRYRGKIQGRKQLEIHSYMKDVANFTRKDIIDELDLHVSPTNNNRLF